MKILRANKQSITDYIASFDLKYRKLEKLSITLSPEILAFKLLMKAKLSKEMRMLVLTGINFSNRNELYEDTKCSLRKFEVMMEENVRTESVKAENKNKSFGNNLMKQTYGGGFNKPSQDTSNRIGTFQYSSNKGPRKKINPFGANGKPLLCNSCGSYRHLLEECPDSWENMEKKNVSENDLNSIFPRVNARICSDDRKGLTRSENKGELLVGLEMNHSVPGELSVEIASLNNEVKCLKEEIRMMKGDKDEQIKEQKQGKKWENSIQEEVIAQITRLKDELTKAKNEIKKMQDDR